jgi:hypothetical protein
MGFNSAFKGLKMRQKERNVTHHQYSVPQVGRSVKFFVVIRNALHFESRFFL